jgi:hypothetical protein
VDISSSESGYAVTRWRRFSSLCIACLGFACSSTWTRERMGVCERSVGPTSMCHLMLPGDRGHRASCRHMRFMCMFHPGVACVSTRCCIYNAMAIHICCKCIFQMFQLFLYGCCSSRYCICCSDYTRMLQVYVLNVSPVLDICCKI